MPTTGILTRRAALAHHAYRNRKDRWTGKTAGIIMQDRPAGLQVNSHASDGINQRNSVGAGSLGCGCDFANIRHIGGKLDHQRLCTAAADRFGDGFYTVAGQCQMQRRLP